ncbi:MAG: exodeoxyribonuclease VII large subunit [Candidatus Eremiobacteraeota bacterium]|nr:exodeoxyribonuclease VII large subunit [Candidatus Eremiobacteraeota bacterium]
MRLFADAQVLQLTVSQFAERLRLWVERRPELQRIAIVGEISEWKPRANGNVYFNLKDDRAVLRCFAFQTEARGFAQVSDGVAVVATGAVGIWERRSEYQLRVFELAALGAGTIAAKIEALRKRLQAEGIFEQARKRALPRFPRCVALVSARGKGAADFESTLHERAPNVTTVFVETRVQGDGAELDIADALERASRREFDAVVLLRGGGSYEDRYPFNTEVVVRAIVRSRHPVVTAIGHTGDHHLADEVADAVFKTPTAAAEYIAASWSEATSRLWHCAQQMARAIDALVARASQQRDTAVADLERAELRVVAKKRTALVERIARLERLNPQRGLTDARARLARGTGRLDTAIERLVSAKQRAGERSRERLDRARTAVQTHSNRQLAKREAALDRFDPLAPLARGYAIVTKNGATLRDVASVRAGDAIEARLERGRLAARVESVASDG